MSEILNIRLPAQEKREWEKAAAAVDETLADYVRNAVRLRAEASGSSPWAKYLGSVDVAVLPPTNINIRRAMNKARQAKV